MPFSLTSAISVGSGTCTALLETALALQEPVGQGWVLASEDEMTLGETRPLGKPPCRALSIWQALDEDRPERRGAAAAIGTGTPRGGLGWD